MEGRDSTRPVFWLVFMLWVLVGCEPAVQAPGVVSTDSAGTLLVEVESLASVQAPAASTEVVFKTSEGGIELFRVTAARILGDGRVAVGNAGTQEVLLLSPSGSVMRTIGGVGAGPGEFRTITTLHRSRDGGFNVYDARLGRLSSFGAEGDLMATEPLNPPNGWTDLRPLSVGPDGEVLAIYGSLRRFPADGVQRDSTPLLAYSGPGTVPDTLSRWATAEKLFSLEEDGWSATDVGFGRSLASFGTNQFAVLGDTERLDVFVLNTSARLVMRIRGGAPAVATTEAEGEQWRLDRVARVRSDLPADLEANIRRRLSEAPFRESYPAFDALAIDVVGRVWIGATAEYGEMERRWVVFGSDGAPLATLQLPTKAEILDATETHLLLSSRDELDVEAVSLLDVRWPR